MTESFWRDPPWRGGKGGYRMGLRPIETSGWLPERIRPEEYTRKRELLASESSGVFAEVDGSRPGQQMILDAVQSALGGAVVRVDEARSPLVEAALRVPDDLCLMEASAGTYRLTAACVCSPSYWRLADKIGRTLDGIHSPVPTLNEKLAPAMQQFFSRLPFDSVFERRNWLIHTSDDLYHPTSDAWRPIALDEIATLTVRSERQTLRRLDNERIVFTIRVNRHRLGEIVDFPEAANDLVAALAGLDPAERSAKGMDYFAPALFDFLSRSSGGPR